jgi:hypothetical protein
MSESTDIAGSSDVECGKNVYLNSFSGRLLREDL